MLVADGLNSMIEKAKDVGFPAGLPSSSDSSFRNLKYTDDTLIFGKNDVRER